MKPGLKTTEFYVTAAGVLLSVLVAMGLVSSTDVEHLTAAVTKIAGAVAVVVANAWVLVRYVEARTGLKVESLDLQAPPAPESDDDTVQYGEEVADDAPTLPRIYPDDSPPGA